jgi:thiol-disulfide isomerase/thioredoxin
MRLRPSRLVWVPVVLLFLIPVAVSLRHQGSAGASSGGGALLYGEPGLDSLLDAWSGRPVILNFWATWCTPCVGELPVLDSLYREMSGTCGVVAVDVGDPDPAAVSEFLGMMHLSMPVVWLDEAEAESIRSRMGVPATLPVTIFLDSSGAEAARVSGARGYSFFESRATAIVEGSGAAEDTAGTPQTGLHVNVVGPAGDSLTSELMEAAILAAGEGHVAFFDPGDPADAARLDSLFLPDTGWPYAQPCVGASCGRPVRTPEDLLEAIGQLSAP